MAGLDTIISQIDDVLGTEFKKPEITGTLLAYGGKENDGLSASRCSAKIIKRIADEDVGGINDWTFPSGNRNVMNELICVIVDEILKEIRLHGRIEVANQVGTEVIAVEEGVGENTTATKSYGIIS